MHPPGRGRRRPVRLIPVSKRLSLGASHEQRGTDRAAPDVLGGDGPAGPVPSKLRGPTGLVTRDATESIPCGMLFERFDDALERVGRIPAVVVSTADHRG